METLVEVDRIGEQSTTDVVRIKPKARDAALGDQPGEPQRPRGRGSDSGGIGRGEAVVVDAAVLLHDLLDRSERGVASPVAYPDRGAFSDVTAKDSFERLCTWPRRRGPWRW